MFYLFVTKVMALEKKTLHIIRVQRDDFIKISYNLLRIEQVHGNCNNIVRKS